MSDSISISALRELYGKSTRGPWQYNSRMWRVEQDTSVYDRDYLPVASPFNRNGREDGAWISAAHNAFPSLLDRIEDLERDNARMQEALGNISRRLREASHFTFDEALRELNFCDDLARSALPDKPATKETT